MDETEEFNQIRSRDFMKTFTSEDSRLFLALGMRKDKSITIIADEVMSPDLLIKYLRFIIEKFENDQVKLKRYPYDSNPFKT